MVMAFRGLPVGIDDYGKLVENGFYYIDKTLFIRELLDNRSEVTLFTRPRRFGKTLNMSMLKYFFEDTMEEAQNSRNRDLFAGKKIMQAGRAYVEWMNSRPVIYLTLKSAKQPSWGVAYSVFKEIISNEFKRLDRVEPLLRLEEDRQKYHRLKAREPKEGELETSLHFLCDCLYEVYGKKVIMLLDEYDVPLENAYYSGFYSEMTGFIRSLMESALKSNVNLEFAVLTGCLRISKESIFTGLNNLKIVSILNEGYSEYFGFTQEEVEEVLHCYGLEHKIEEVREWYNGYMFGNTKIYNPWSVINYISDRAGREEGFPSPYWSNTSSNSIVKDFIYRADGDAKREISRLMAGGAIEKKIHEDITYSEIYEAEENLWNFLFFTGYLKQSGRRMEGLNQYLALKIPNLEVQYIYENSIQNWFREEIKARDLSVMYQAAAGGNAEIFQEELGKLLMGSISYMDSAENFYHGFLLGVLANMGGGYYITSNREAGKGRYDICVRNDDVSKAPVIIELKVARAYKELEEACNAALMQIEEKDYDGWLVEEGYSESIRYGIGFFRKQCKVRTERKKLI